VRRSYCGAHQWRRYIDSLLHNYSLETQTVTVNLSAPGLEIRSQNDEQITIQPGTVRPVGWRVRVKSAKPTEVTITARGATGVLDTVLLPLALQPAAIKDVQNQSGSWRHTDGSSLTKRRTGDQ
jgi:hypothetical protein